jgi:hypothetical protein
VTTKEAKDFLVEETAQQAALEGTPLSDLEKRMMYFTESDPVSCPNPMELNDEFEAQYDVDEYEEKTNRLLHSAYKRLKEENSEKIRQWRDALSELKRGDHYILVLWNVDVPSSSRDPQDALKLWGTALLIAGALLLITFLGNKFAH